MRKRKVGMVCVSLWVTDIDRECWRDIAKDRKQSMGKVIRLAMEREARLYYAHKKSSELESRMHKPDSPYIPPKKPPVPSSSQTSKPTTAQAQGDPESPI